MINPLNQSTHTPCQPQREGPQTKSESTHQLTKAQRNFSLLLAELLAKLWHQEQLEKSKASLNVTQGDSTS